MGVGRSRIFAMLRSCHLFTADRVQYIIVANTPSLYSGVMFGRGITDESRFLERAVATIRDVLEDDGQAFVFRQFIAPQSGTVRFAKALDRSLTGSLNELVATATILFEERQYSPHAVADHLNDFLLSRLASERSPGYSKPREAFRRSSRTSGPGPGPRAHPGRLRKGLRPVIADLGPARPHLLLRRRVPGNPGLPSGHRMGGERFGLKSLLGRRPLKLIRVELHPGSSHWWASMASGTTRFQRESNRPGSRRRSR